MIDSVTLIYITAVVRETAILISKNVADREEDRASIIDWFFMRRRTVVSVRGELSIWNGCLGVCLVPPTRPLL